MNLICILYSFVAVLLKLLKPGGIKAISAENVLLRQQLITLKRRHKRSPKLTLSDRLIYGLLTTLIHPKRLFPRWQANLRILEIHELKTIPHVPLSHPFVERLIGTVRRDFLDKTFFWNQHDLENKLNEFKKYYNASRAHSSLGSLTPDDSDKQTRNKLLSIKKYGWEGHCKNLFSLPIAA
jgi:hypothetical protein